MVDQYPLILQGTDRFEIVGLRYVMAERVILRDEATLIIRDSLFEQMVDEGPLPPLMATGKARVIVERSEVRANVETAWRFMEDASVSWR